jgi:uncharacterized membrane protein YphA (DoxX/SURF4 family)
MLFKNVALIGAVLWVVHFGDGPGSLDEAGRRQRSLRH